MADYTLHLGYNWNSPTVGSIWGRTSDDRFLDYALANATGDAAWFQFQVDDNLYVQLWDLSTLKAPLPSSWILNMSLGPLDEGQTQTYDPSSYMSLNGNASVESQRVGETTNPYLQFSSFDFSFNSSGPYTCPWAPYRGYSSPVGPVTFTSDLTFKLSFYLKSTAMIGGNPDMRVFISDPETRIGSGRPG